MKFLWPQWLWLAAILPLLVARYILMLRRRQKRALRYASLVDRQRGARHAATSCAVTFRRR